MVRGSRWVPAVDVTDKGLAVGSAAGGDEVQDHEGGLIGEEVTS
jgi:hypothetical protein